MRESGGEKKKQRVRTEEELKKALLNDPEFRDEILKELKYSTGRRGMRMGVRLYKELLITWRKRYQEAHSGGM